MSKPKLTAQDYSEVIIRSPAWRFPKTFFAPNGNIDHLQFLPNMLIFGTQPLSEMWLHHKESEWFKNCFFGYCFRLLTTPGPQGSLMPAGITGGFLSCPQLPHPSHPPLPHLTPSLQESELWRKRKNTVHPFWLKASLWWHSQGYHWPIYFHTNDMLVTIDGFYFFGNVYTLATDL